MLVKKLVRHGNSQAIALDKQTLNAAGLDENAMFQIIIEPNGGLLIRSVTSSSNEVVMKSFDKMFNKNLGVLKRLADR